MIKNIIKTLKNTILCIKYPFLYPRNRFTDNHYTNRIIHNKIYELNRTYLLSMSVGVMSDETFSEELEKLKGQKEGEYPIVEISKGINYSDRHLSVSRNGNEMIIGVEYKGKTKYKTFNISDYLDRTSLTSNDIEGVFLGQKTTKTLMGVIEQRPYIVFVLKNSIENKDSCPSFNFVKIDLLGYTKLYIGLLKLLNKFLGVFHILPSYTELDAMENGWRERFGEKMCKEIRNSILTTYIRKDKPTSIFGKIKAYCKGIKHLLSYRIQQIKEKYASLRWYAYGDTEDTLKIINKYENISMKTCIVCGKAATYRSIGWICPFCEEHKPDNAVKLGDEYWY